MAALSGWLQQIVAVILLASLVDLLLPNRTMQRYVRLVAGLLILLTVATPALQWIKSDYQVKLASDLDRLKLSPKSDAADLAKIEADGARLGEARGVQAEKLATARLSSQIRAALEEAGYGPVRTVEVTAAVGDSGATELSAVELVLETKPDDEGAGEEPDSDIADVRPVDPVDIDIGGVGGGVAEATGAFSPEQAQAADAEMTGRIDALLGDRFGIPAGKIQVTIASGSKPN